MKTKKRYHSILKAVEVYETLLRGLREDEFILKPSPNEWSYSETFSHIFGSNLASLIAVEKCKLGTAGKTSARPSWAGFMVLIIGRLPETRTSAVMAAAVKVLSMEEASNLIIRFKKRLGEVIYGISEASPYTRIKHPRLGFLNAAQWLRFIEIHTWHHTRQLRRIEEKLAGCKR